MRSIAARLALLSALWTSSAGALPTAPAYVDGAPIPPDAGVLVFKLDHQVYWSKREVRRGRYHGVLGVVDGAGYVLPTTDAVQAVVLPPGLYYLSSVEGIRDDASGVAVYQQDKPFRVVAGVATWAGTWEVQTRLKDMGQNVHCWIRQRAQDIEEVQRSFPKLAASSSMQRGAVRGWVWPFAAATPNSARALADGDALATGTAAVSLVLEPVVSLEPDAATLAADWTLELERAEDGSRWALGRAQRPALFELPAGNYFVIRAESSTGDAIEDFSSEERKLEFIADRINYAGVWHSEPKRKVVSVRFDKAPLESLVATVPKQFAGREIWLSPLGQPARSLKPR